MGNPEIYNPLQEKNKVKKGVRVDKMGVRITDLEAEEQKESAEREAWREQQ